MTLDSPFEPVELSDRPDKTHKSLLPSPFEPAESSDQPDKTQNSILSIADDLATGGKPLIDGKRLDVRVVVVLLRDETTVHPSVPKGRKDNVCFTVDNKDNHERRLQEDKSHFIDDCVEWLENQL